MAQAPASAHRMSVVGEVLAVLRLAFTMRLDASRLVGRDATIALLGAAALAVWVVLAATWTSRPRATSSLPASRNWPRSPPRTGAGMAGGASQPAAASDAAHPVAGGGIPAGRRGGGLGAQSAHVLHAGSMPSPRSPASTRRCISSSGCARSARRSPWLPFAALALGTVCLHRPAPAYKLDFAVWSLRLNPDQVADYRESEQRTEELMYLQAERIDAALDRVRCEHRPRQPTCISSALQASGRRRCSPTRSRWPRGESMSVMASPTGACCWSMTGAISTAIRWRHAPRSRARWPASARA